MIYDCVIFFNELDLLEMRLNELDEVVDRFVVVEAPVTFSGKPKPLIFSENVGLFERWSERIIHVVVHDMPGGSDSWARERHQRNAILRGLGGASPNDGIIISDTDEIPHPEVVRRWRPEMGPHQFDQMFCYYWINCVSRGWAGSRIATFSQVIRLGGPEVLRQNPCTVFCEGGWHFSFLGGPTMIREKLEAYSHQDLNRPPFKDGRYLEEVTSLGINLFNRNTSFRFSALDDRFPKTVLANRARYAHFIREAAFHEDWYSGEQLLKTCALFSQIAGLNGVVMEIGCWEGRSTIALAHACHPEPLLAIDSWKGSLDESPTHSSVIHARERDVFKQFLTNVQLLTKGNVVPIRQDCHAFLREWREPIKFAHLDSSHDYRSVKAALEGLFPWIIPGGVLCGSNFETAGASRADLDGGVERAVREMLPGFQQDGNLWSWRKPAISPP